MTGRVLVKDVHPNESRLSGAKSAPICDVTANVPAGRYCRRG